MLNCIDDKNTEDKIKSLSITKLKTYLVALFACVRCILYPGTKIIAFSATFKQGKEIILKITDDFMHKSNLLCNEISKVSTGQNDCGVWFKNGSFIQVRVAADTSRGARANIIIVDESRLVDSKIISTVIKPMNSSPRSPRYLEKPEYKHLQEPNREIYMSSAWYKASEMYANIKDYTANMLRDGLSYFICDLPYQLSIMEGLLLRDGIRNEMSEETFSDISFKMEREGIFYGSSEDALFTFDVLNACRKIDVSFYPLSLYRSLNIPVPDKDPNEKRILSLDIALMASKKHNNDASCFIINSAMFTKDNNCVSKMKYIETQEGLLTEDLALMTMRYFYQYKCDYLGIDAKGIGVPIIDLIMQDRYDPVYDITYKAMTVINNDDLADRCKVKDARKVIYAIKGSAELNSTMALNLRSGLQNGNIELLINDNSLQDEISKVFKGYSKLNSTQQGEVFSPYIQTSFLVEELINLDHEANGKIIKVKEKPGMRKDRFSSLEYNYYVVNQIRAKKRRKKQENNLASILPIRKAKRFSSF